MILRPAALLAALLFVGAMGSSGGTRGGARADSDPVPVAEPIQIVDPKAAQRDFHHSESELPHDPRLKTAIVFRADATRPQEIDGSRPVWTYHHHPDIAAFQKTLWVAWDSCKRDEDTGLSRELYATSADGQNWQAPKLLFPEGSSTALRMYFYHDRKTGRMLAIAGLRVIDTTRSADDQKISEDTKGPLLVRELKDPQTLGDIYALRPPDRPDSRVLKAYPSYGMATDPGFVTACQNLLADHLFLEQQDHGKLLDPRDRIAWDDSQNWSKLDKKLKKDAGGFGRAQCFYTRLDKTLVAIGKQGWVTTSTDEGKTWQTPSRPRTLVTGNGKVWGQRTPDGQYLLAYNPDATLREPLAFVTGEDGVTFGDMRNAIQYPLPPQRYPGLNKDTGASYVRGLSPWNSDDSVSGVWLVYSVNKEEIWVSHLSF